MKIWSTAMAVTLLSIAACSDDDDGAKQKTGVFIEGPVKGLRFATTSGSGVTNERGEFTYRDGESVTFSVGGITLGSATGAAKITPFELFGLTPPTTERELRSLLNGRRVGAFDRVMNVATFLMALDVDRDPVNGIDLGEADTGLANATIDFEMPFAEFCDETMESFAARHPGARVDLLPPAVLNHLYASLGVSLTVHMLSKLTTDYDDDGTINRGETFTYDAQGRLTRSVGDYDGDGVDDSVRDNTYDVQGRIVRTDERYDDDGNGVLETRGESTYTFADSGVQLTLVSELYINNILDSRTTYTSTLDPLGHIATTITEHDEDADSVIDARDTSTYTYDGAGRRILQVVDRDENADGTPDSHDEYVTTYDLAGFVSASTTRNDYEADGVFNMVYDYTYARDSKGRITSQTRTQTSAGTVIGRTATAEEWDARGLNVKTIRALDNNADGAIEQRSTTVRTFDDRGNILTETQEADLLDDGSVNSRSTYEWQYDDMGFQTRQTYVRDSNNDGMPESMRATTYTHDANGNEVESVTQWDEDGDGTYDDTERSKSEYVPVEGAPGGALDEGVGKAMLIA